MKPQYKTFVDNCKSALDATYLTDRIQSQIDKIIDAYPKILKSSLPIYITIIVNPNNERLQNANNLGNGFYMLLSPEIESDTTMFALQARIATIKTLEGVQRCLLAISTHEDYPLSKEVKTQNEDEDTPVFIPQDPRRSFDEIILSKKIKEKIFKALSIIKNRELIFEKWAFKRTDHSTKSILCFYGPAGTGKTMTAEAIGSYLGKKIIFSSYAEIESQWVGVGAKNLHAIFKTASENDAILFFDEADSFLSNRLSHTSSGSDKHYNRMSNELFQLLENFDGCVIFATNLLTDIDEAFKSRIIDSIRFELPNSDERIMMIKKMLPQEYPLDAPLSDEQYSELANITEGFSGRDLRKSVLLSLASSAIDYLENDKHIFKFEDVRHGFLEVKQSKEDMQKELGVLDDVSLGEKLLEHQILNEKIISMAKLACLSDGEIDDYERNMIKELTRNLIGVEDSEITLSSKETVDNVCSNLKNDTQKLQLLDVAIRIIAANNQVLDDEIAFLMSVMSELSVKPEKVNSIIEYTKHAAVLNSEFEKIQANLFDSDLNEKLK